MAKSQRTQVFIEKIFPVKLLNQQVYYEHGGNPFKGLHRWYSRKPLSFSRASVLASLLPADISMEEFEYLLGLHLEKDGVSRNVPGNALTKDGKIKLYKSPPTSRIIEKLEEYCDQVWGKRKPVVLDAFAGGGSIPFEAARYGLNVLASDLNPVAVVTMKAAMEYPLKFGADLQQDIDRWVKYVGDEAEKRLAEFFPSNEGEKVQNYLWAHTVVCPHCESVVPLSPNWWLYKRPEKQNLHKWCAVKPISNPKEKRVDFELIKGSKGKGTIIETDNGEYDPSTTTTISRGVGKCLNCNNVIEYDYIINQGGTKGLGHQLYAVAYKEGEGGLKFRIPNELDFEGLKKANSYIKSNLERWNLESLSPDVQVPYGHMTSERCTMIQKGLDTWDKLFNPRQLLTLVTYVEIINEAKSKLEFECEPEKVKAIAIYLALVLDRCVDENCRLAHWNSARGGSRRATAQHSLNLMWNYPEVSGDAQLWRSFANVYRIAP